MTKLNIHQAKTHLSRYIKKVQQGEEIVICKNNEPIVQIIPFRHNKPKFRRPGLSKGFVLNMKNINEPLTENEFPGVGLSKKRRTGRS